VKPEGVPSVVLGMRTTASLFTILLALPLVAACQGTTTAVADSVQPRTSGAAPVTAPAAQAAGAGVGTDPGHAGRGTALTPGEGHALAAFAEGCFWGSEDTFRHVPGVLATAVGYTGGHTDDPSYESVCTHTTGHAETVLVEFDPGKVSYEKLLAVFFSTHDPTTKDRQGPDVGDQYRSAVFTFSPEQEAAARAAAARETASRPRPVTTAIQPIGRFWKAEGYHQQYDEKSGRKSCPLPGQADQGT
jgi:peptide-methionine (S)-S-oxide reductase